MTSRLILARHGNTFNPQDKPVWVGARSDLPLVQKGIEQAQALANALRKTNLLPDAIIAGPLQRTRRTAEIIVEILKISSGAMRIDPRLTEIDYGAWEGKSNEDIIAAGSSAELEAWSKHSLFPTHPCWSPSEAQIIANTNAILDEVSEETALIVTSNGILRFFARSAVNAAEFPDRKVATGHLCVMEREDKGWRILQWNQGASGFQLFF